MCVCVSVCLSVSAPGTSPLSPPLPPRSAVACRGAPPAVERLETGPRSEKCTACVPLRSGRVAKSSGSIVSSLCEAAPRVSCGRVGKCRTVFSNRCDSLLLPALITVHRSCSPFAAHCSPPSDCAKPKNGRDTHGIVASIPRSLSERLSRPSPSDTAEEGDGKETV